MNWVYSATKGEDEDIVDQLMNECNRDRDTILVNTRQGVYFTKLKSLLTVVGYRLI